MLSVLQSQVKPQLELAQEWLAENPRLALSSAAAFLGVSYLASSAIKKPSNLPPGPKPLPIVGSRHLLDYTKIHESLHELSKQYGDVFTIYVFSEPIIIVNSYQAVKDALCSDRHLFAGRPFAEDYLKAMNEDVFMADFSDHWKVAKKSGMNAMRNFAGPQSDIEDVMQAEVDFTLNEFAKCAGTTTTSNEIRKVLFKATGNVLSAFMFGVHYDDHDDPELTNYLDQIITWYDHVNASFPWDGFDPAWLVRYNFGAGMKKFAEACRKMREHVKTIMQRIGTPDKQNPRSFLEYFMANRDVDAMGGVDGLADTIGIYTVDPVDTMCSILQWAVLYLAHFPHVQQRMRKLIEEVAGPGQRVTCAHRGDLGLVESFLHELQRHANVTCITFPHTATRDTQFRGYDVPKGTMLYANVYGAHLDAEKHPDPELFKADRFVDENGKFMKADSVFTFGAGARSCPGDIHTRMELYLMVANLVNRFDIAFPPDAPNQSLDMSETMSFFKAPHNFKVIMTPR